MSTMFNMKCGEWVAIQIQSIVNVLRIIVKKNCIQKKRHNKKSIFRENEGANKC